jgi:hypothetical protein
VSPTAKEGTLANGAAQHSISGTLALCIVIAAALLNAIFWTYRVSAFRKDRRWVSIIAWLSAFAFGAYVAWNSFIVG